MEQDLHHTFLGDSQILQCSLPLAKHRQTEELLRQTTYSSRCIENGFLTTFICDKLWSHSRAHTESLLLGVIFAILFTKIVFGDYDKGYQWTRSDLLFVLIVGGEGALGAWITSKGFRVKTLRTE